MSPLRLDAQLRKLATDSKTGLDVNQLRVVVALERAVARLEHEPKLQGHLVFKGGFVLFKTIRSPRFTRDLDAVVLDMDQKKVAQLAASALELNLNDELWFLDVRSEEIPDQGEYGGLRLNCAFQIGTEPPAPSKIKKLSRIHIDIGFGDEVPRSARTTEIPMRPLAQQLEPVSWHIYPMEFIFAEKLQTLFERGALNSRAKDVYDLVEIFPLCSDTAHLKQAVLSVFLNRKTSVPAAFAKELGLINPSVLKGAWPSITKSIGPKSLEGVWAVLFWPLLGISFPTLSYGVHGKLALFFECFGGMLLTIQFFLLKKNPPIYGRVE